MLRLDHMPLSPAVNAASTASSALLALSCRLLLLTKACACLLLALKLVGRNPCVRRDSTQKDKSDCLCGLFLSYSTDAQQYNSKYSSQSQPAIPTHAQSVQGSDKGGPAFE
jgi:hypothetical protein